MSPQKKRLSSIFIVIRQRHGRKRILRRSVPAVVADSVRCMLLRPSPRPTPAPPSRGRACRATARAQPAARGADAAVLCLFRLVLRLHDHDALAAALRDASARRSTVACAFLWTPQDEATCTGAASRLWLHATLSSLSSSLKTRHATPLLFLDTDASLRSLLIELKCVSVHASSRHGLADARADAALASSLRRCGVDVTFHEGQLLHPPGAVHIDPTIWHGGHFGTLSPLLGAVNRLGPVPPPLPPPKVGAPFWTGGEGGASANFASFPGCCVTLDALGLARMPRRADGSVVDWGAAVLGAWGGDGCAGEDRGLASLTAFASPDGLRRYEASRHTADGAAVSRLSPFIRWGVLSPRRVVAAAAAAGGAASSRTFAHRLAWRDLAHWQHSLFGEALANTGTVRGYAPEWVAGATRDSRLAAWKSGATGYPLVDAAMRQLRATGWMPQSSRMAAAAFLVRCLRVDWRHGAAAFDEMLLDADAAINAMMWANAACVGLDPWSFSPSPLSRHSDPTGASIAAYLPELASLPPGSARHAPWAAPPQLLASCGVVLGQTYPHRIISDPSAAEEAFFESLRTARAASLTACVDDGGYDVVVVPSGGHGKRDMNGNGNGDGSGGDGTKGGVRVRLFTHPEVRRARGGEGKAGRAREELPPPAPPHDAGAAAPAPLRSKAAPQPRRRPESGSGGAATGSAKTGDGAAVRKPRPPRRVRLADAPVVRAGNRDRSRSVLQRYRGAPVDRVEEEEEALSLR